jgi:chlorobactene glucosyltransferase
MGKSHACWIAARQVEAEWLCFIDADTIADPALMRSALIQAKRNKLDFLSLEPRQELRTVSERLVLPAGLFALAFTRDLRRVNDPHSPQASANGQFILLRRSVYRNIGGHAAVCMAIAEDSQLAHLVKAAGYRIAVLNGAQLIRARMYRSFGALWQGLSKNSIEALGGVCSVVSICVLGVPLAWAVIGLPLLLLAHLQASSSVSHLVVLGLAILASLAVVVLHFVGARYLDIPGWCGLLFPVGYTLAAILALDGLLRRCLGQIRWKGRSYRSRPKRAHLAPTVRSVR